MAKGDDFQRILDQANRRAKFRTKTDFPNAIVKHGQKVIDWFNDNDMQWNVAKFKHMFIHFGQGKLGNENFIKKVVPIIWTDAEFEALLSQMGYDIADPESSDPWTVMVTGDKEWEDQSYINRVLRGLSPDSTVVAGSLDGAETMAMIVANSLGFATVEEQAVNKQEIESLIDDNDIEGLVVFHTDPKSSKRTMFIARLCKERDIPIKVLKGDKRFDILDWLEENYE